MQYGEMVALAALLARVGRQQESDSLSRQAEVFRRHILELLWDTKLEFFVGLKPRGGPAIEAALAADANMSMPLNSR